MYVRPVTSQDHAGVLQLAELAGIGMTSLPPDANVLRAKIERAVASIQGQAVREADESYLFVLEDPEAGQIAGICGIVCHVGLRQPFYSYKLSTITQTSESLGIFSQQQVLHVVNDYTGTSEIGSLYLRPEYRRDRLGRLLSRIRFLFMAEFRERFATKVISEIRGVHDRAGHSPFYDHLAKPFFQMEFARADYLSATQGNQFIADLMPKYPIYVSLLPQAAQEVIGQPFAASEPAKAMLEHEGFRFNDYLDIFDGGPTLEARVEDLRAVRESRRATVAVVRDYVEAERFLACTTVREGFRGAIVRVEVVEEGVEENHVAISRRAATSLNLSVGDRMRYTAF